MVAQKSVMNDCLIAASQPIKSHTHRAAKTNRTRACDRPKQEEDGGRMIDQLFNKASVEDGNSVPKPEALIICDNSKRKERFDEDGMGG